MPNLVINYKCNKNCNYCFVCSARSKKTQDAAEMSLENFNRVLDFLRKSGKKTVRIMGGEPTLHARFREMIDSALAKKFSIYVFTNGLFDEGISDFLLRRGKKINYAFNVDAPEAYTPGNWSMLEKNLKKLSILGNCLIGGVIWKADFTIDHLIEMAKKYRLDRAIMLRPANPIFGGKNTFLSSDQFAPAAENLIKEVVKAYRDKVKIGFGCGLPAGMFTSEEIRKFKKNNVVYLKLGCFGNSGKFDIGPDLSVFRCFPLSNWEREHLFNFKDCKEVKNHFREKMKDYVGNLAGRNVFSEVSCFARLLNDEYEKTAV